MSLYEHLSAIDDRFLEIINSFRKTRVGKTLERFDKGLEKHSIDLIDKAFYSLYCILEFPEKRASFDEYVRDIKE